MTPEQARDFGTQWISAWNAHDVKRLLSYCAQGFEMSSPLAADSGASASGVIKGRAAVGEYWTQTLLRVPGSRFELVDVLSGVESVVVLFRTMNGKLAAQVLEFDGDGRIVRGAAHFAL
jgi:hypothetical protein